MRRALVLLVLFSPKLRCEGADPPGDAVVGVGATGALIPDGSLSYELLDHAGQPLSAQARWSAFEQRCRQAIKKALEEPANGGTPSMLTLYPDPMTGVSVEPRNSPDDVRIVYVVLASRPWAASVVSRLVRALYHPSHLFLIHADLKANASMHERLQAFAAARPNVHVLKTRRLVQWAGFTMVLALLDALSSFVDRLDFDFAVPLADSELALRTNEEMVDFLMPFKGRSFVRVEPHEPGGGLGPSEGRAVSHELLARRPVIECGGFGFVSVNATLARPDSRRPCCFGSSGPLVEATIPYAPPQPKPTEHVYTGSQWGILSAELARYLVRDPAAHRWGRILERRLLADELFLPSVVMNSRFRYGLVNHHLRGVRWPHAHFTEPSDYWGLAGAEWGGAMFLNASDAAEGGLVRGPMLFARKFSPVHDPALVLEYDGWMSRKLGAEPDPLQAPIAARWRHTDPELYALQPPHEPPAREGAPPHSPSDKRPVRRTRRRRIRALRFADGSSCSCAPGCAQSDDEAGKVTRGGKAGGVDSSDSGDSGEVGVGSESSQADVCCAVMADAHKALCSAGGGGAAGDAPPAVVEDVTERSGVRELRDEGAGHGHRPPTSPLTPPPGVSPPPDGSARPAPPPGVRPCPEERPGLATGAGGQECSLLFINRAPYPVRLFNVDALGGEVPLQIIRVDEHAEYTASTAHAWRVRSLRGSLLLELEGVARVDIPGPAVVHILDCEPVITD